MWNKCKYCEEDFSSYNLGQKMNHTKFCEKNPNKEENIKKQRKATEKSRSCISEECRKQINQSISNAWKEGKYKDKKNTRNPWNNDQKQRISVSRKKWMSENVDKHPWKKSTKFVSVPCEFLKKKLKDIGLIFEEEWTPLTDRYFSIDIAFPNVKIGIEVNGEQHYNRDGSLRDYYQKRHDLIESNGWKLFELHYAKVYDDTQIGPIVQWIERESSKL